MYDVTQQRLDENDILKASIFSNAGVTDKSGLVIVAILESPEHTATQQYISDVTTLPQGLVSKCLKELVSKEWVKVEQETPTAGRGRPVYRYTIVSIKQIAKDLTDNLNAHIKVTKANITDMLEVYK